MDRLERSGKINDSEKYRLKDDIETKEGEPKDGNVSERMRKELRRLKVIERKVVFVFVTCAQ